MQDKHKKIFILCDRDATRHVAGVCNVYESIEKKRKILMKKQGKPKLTNCTKDGVCAARSHTQTVVLVFAYFLCRGFSSTQKLVLCVCV